MTERPGLPYLWMLVSSLSFATMGVCAHRLGYGIDRTIDWRIIALARSGLPLVFALAFALATRVRLVLWRPRTLWVRSCAGSVGLVCTFYALTKLPVSDVFTVTNMFPVWVALLSWPLLGERPSAATWVAVGIGFLGVICIQQPHLAAGNLAALLAVVASFASSIVVIGLHRLQGLHPWAIIVHFSAVALLVCVGACFVAPWEPSTLESLGGRQFALLLAVGVFATVGQFFMTIAFTTGSPAKVSVVGLTQVVFTLAVDVALFNHHFTPATLVGMALVMSPTAWLMAGAGAQEA